MGRAPCCDKASVKKGPWSPEEDEKLKSYIEQNGTGGNWIALPQKIGLKRCGKSCRLRWLNYLRPNIKHGSFSDQEDNIICHLYLTIGSRWSIIANYLPGRTDNDIKNYWNTKLKKKLLGKQRKEKASNSMKQDLMVKQENHENNSADHIMVPMINQPIPTNNYWRDIPSLVQINQTQVESTPNYQYLMEHGSIKGGNFSHPMGAGSGSEYNPVQELYHANSMNIVSSSGSMNSKESSTSCSQVLNFPSTNYSITSQAFQGQGGLESSFNIEYDEFVYRDSLELENLEGLYAMDMSNNGSTNNVNVGSSNTSVESSNWSDISSIVNYPQQLLFPDQFENTYPTQHLPQFVQDTIY